MKLLVTGGTGQVGGAVVRLARAAGHQVQAPGRAELDLCRVPQLRAVLAARRPEVVVNAAAYTAVDRAESEPELAMQVNGAGPRLLAAACRDVGAHLMHLSTEMVFDGRGSTPWVETDAVAPLSAYGASKAEGEEGVRAELSQALILRTSWVFSAQRRNFVKAILGAARDGRPLRVVTDQLSGPTWAEDIAAALLQLAEVRATGTLHFAGSPAVSPHGFAEAIVAAAVPDHLAERVPVQRILSADWASPAERPPNAALDCSAFTARMGHAPPSWRAGLRTTLARLRP